jgi:phosphate transport system permease protein
MLHLNPLLPVETMTAYIVQISQGDTPHGTLEYHTLFAVAMVLFIFTMCLNIVSLMVRDRFKRMYR